MLNAAARYVQPCKNVIKLLERNFTLVEIRCIMSIPAHLLEQCIEIIREHHSDIIENNSHVT